MKICSGLTPSSSALRRAGSSSSPWPRSAVKVTTRSRKWFAAISGLWKCRGLPNRRGRRVDLGFGLDIGRRLWDGAVGAVADRARLRSRDHSGARRFAPPTTPGLIDPRASGAQPFRVRRAARARAAEKPRSARSARRTARRRGNGRRTRCAARSRQRRTPPRTR